MLLHYRLALASKYGGHRPSQLIMSACSSAMREKKDLSPTSSSRRPRGSAIDQTWNSSRGITFRTPPCDRSWRPSRGLVFSNGNADSAKSSSSSAALASASASATRSLPSLPLIQHQHSVHPVPANTSPSVDDRLSHTEEWGEASSSSASEEGIQQAFCERDGVCDEISQPVENRKRFKLRSTKPSLATYRRFERFIGRQLKYCRWKYNSRVRILHRRGKKPINLRHKLIERLSKTDLHKFIFFKHRRMAYVSEVSSHRSAAPVRIRIEDVREYRLHGGLHRYGINAEMGRDKIISADQIKTPQAPATTSIGNLSISHTKPLYSPLGFHIPNTNIQKIQNASPDRTRIYWQYTLYQGPSGENVIVDYCKDKESTELVAQKFLDQKVIGFDIEWKAQASAKQGVRKNVALIQLASEERIALFHIALYPEGDTLENLVAPTLQKIMESSSITKAGVSIKADCTRLRRFMGIDAHGLFELSHLYKLVKYSTDDTKKINKLLVSLAQQVEEHFQLPLWKGEVRDSDWTKELTEEQIRYAASDSYAAVHLYHFLDDKRKSLSPTPPMPFHAELNLPIRLGNNETIATDDEPEACDDVSSTSSADAPGPKNEIVRDLNIIREDSSATKPVVEKAMSKPLQSSADAPEPKIEIVRDLNIVHEDSSTTKPVVEKAKSKPLQSSADAPEPKIKIVRDLNIVHEDSSTTKPVVKKAKSKPLQRSTPVRGPEFEAAREWVELWLTSRSPTDESRVMATQLRAYALWHEQGKNVWSTAKIMRDPPLKKATVATYVLDVLELKELPFNKNRIADLLMCLPKKSRSMYYKFLLSKGWWWF